MLKMLMVVGMLLVPAAANSATAVRVASATRPQINPRYITSTTSPSGMSESATRQQTFGGHWFFMYYGPNRYQLAPYVLGPFNNKRQCEFFRDAGRRRLALSSDQNKIAETNVNFSVCWQS